MDDIPQAKPSNSPNVKTPPVRVSPSPWLGAEPAIQVRDATMASQNPTRMKLLALSFGLAISLAPLITVATPCQAKTRPPIEAGDPDIGNEKPRGSAQVTVLVKGPAIHETAAFERYEGLRFLSFVFYALRSLYRF